MCFIPRTNIMRQILHPPCSKTSGVSAASTKEEGNSLCTHGFPEHNLDHSRMRKPFCNWRMWDANAFADRCGSWGCRRCISGPGQACPIAPSGLSVFAAKHGDCQSTNQVRCADIHIDPHALRIFTSGGCHGLAQPQDLILAAELCFGIGLLHCRS